MIMDMMMIASMYYMIMTCLPPDLKHYDGRFQSENRNLFKMKIELTKKAAGSKVARVGYN